MVERGVVRNVSAGSLVSHGENLTLECIDLYEPAHGLATFTCNNGTWNVIPRCEPGKILPTYIHYLLIFNCLKVMLQTLRGETIYRKRNID